MRSFHIPEKEFSFDFIFQNFCSLQNRYWKGAIEIQSKMWIISVILRKKAWKKALTLQMHCHSNLKYFQIIFWIQFYNFPDYICAIFRESSDEIICYKNFLPPWPRYGKKFGPPSKSLLRPQHVRFTINQYHNLDFDWK